MRLWPPWFELGAWVASRLMRAGALLNLLAVLVDYAFLSGTLLGQPIYLALTYVCVSFANFSTRRPEALLVVYLEPRGVRGRWVTTWEDSFLLRLLSDVDQLERNRERTISWQEVQLVTVSRRSHALLVYSDNEEVIASSFSRPQDKQIRRVLNDLAPEQYQPDPWWIGSSSVPSYLGLRQLRRKRMPGLNADRMPVQYFYFSERLLRDLYGFFEVKNPSWRAQMLELTLPVVKAQLQRQPSVANLAWVASKVTPALSDHTGTALYPGEYVRDELDMTWGVLPQGVDKRLIAWLYSFERTEEGLVFVGLCGSVANYLDYHGSLGEWSGWYPSSLRGMNEVVTALTGEKEDYDAVQAVAGKIFTDTDERFSREFSTLVQEAFETSRAINSDIDLGGADFLVGQGRCEIMFRVFQSYTNIEIHGIKLRSAIVGAQVWVAPARPRSLDLFS
jgi:hypothetical protein